VVTLSGYGVRVAVDSGHLSLSDGMGTERRAGRIARTEKLSRLVVIGHSGTISIGAVRWLHGVGAALAVIDADGGLLVTSTPPGSLDAALRRAQALASSTPAGLTVTRALLDCKFAGQASVLASLDVLGAAAVSAIIDDGRAALAAALDPSGPRFPRRHGWGEEGEGIRSALDRLRLIEAQGASLYWELLATVPVRFVRRAASSVPEHWRTVGQRHSPLSGSPHHAVTPAHAVLNYLYAVAETEVTIAATAAGLDPTIGVLHADSGPRASLTLDILDALRPEVDRFALTLLTGRPLSLHDVGELPSGVCRLRPGFATVLSETASRWRDLAVPAVEMVASMLRDSVSGSAVRRTPRAQGSRVAAVPGAPGRLLRGRPDAPGRGPGRCADCGAVDRGRANPV
jgi:CRISP-associated protein Cas1